MKIFNKLILAGMIVLAGITTNAQSFGFGCLGLSGFYAGLSREQYDASGINDYLNYQLYSNTLTSTPIKFEKGTGYRIGANFFRAKFSKLFITAKGYYQFLKEEHTVSENSSSNIISKYTLSLNHWGVGLDIGTNLFWVLDWKILEGNVTFFSGDFTSEFSQDNVILNDSKFSLDKTQIGYYVGSGLILHLVPDYISVESTAGFNFVKIDKLKRTDALGNDLFINNAIPGGGFSVTIQLNVGFPF